MSRLPVLAFSASLALMAVAPVQAQPRREMNGEDARLQAFIKASNEADLGRDPTRRGVAPDFTPVTEAYRQQSVAIWRGRAADLPTAVDRDKLSVSAKVQYDIYANALSAQALEADVRGRAYFITGNVLNFNIVDEPSDVLKRRHPIRSKADAQAYVQRLKALPAVLEDAVTVAKARAARGVTMIEATFPAVIEKAEALSHGAPCMGDGENSLWADFQGKLEGAADIPGDDKASLLAAGRSAIADGVCAAYAKYAADVRVLQKSPRIEGLWSTPGGREAYADIVELSLNARVDPEDLHQLGLKEVARLQGEIAALRQARDLPDDLALKTNPRASLDNTEQGRAAYEAKAETYLDAMWKRLPEVFAFTPPRDSLIVRMGEIGSQYTRDEVNGRQVGVYNLARPRGDRISTIGLATLSHHEGVPGHHLQNMTLAAMRTGPDLFQRPFSAAFNEGWGVYAERLADELGVYKDDPVGRLGYLESLLERAERLVLDTGLNAKGWTIAEAEAHQRGVTGEVGLNRFLNWPGQALGYYWGYLEIVKLREEARRELGPRFDLKGFHTAVLRNGAVPFPVVERVVDDWIAQVKAEGL